MPAIKMKKLLAASALYTVFAYYLYQHHLADFRLVDYLLPVNAVIAASGCFILSSRWVNTAVARMLAGAIYGFGPFFLSFSCYHPSAQTLIAVLPWLLCPAALWPLLKPAGITSIAPRTKAGKLFCKTSRLLLWLLPFIAIPLFFILAGRYGLFPVPKTARLHAANLAGLLTPFAITPGGFIVGFYHAPAAALVMGLFVFAVARPLKLMAILIAGAALAFCGSVFQVSPVVWAALPILCCSILIGIGAQALAWSTVRDKKWILACVGVMAACTIVSGLLATQKPAVYFYVACMYCAAMLGQMIIFCIARAKLRLYPVRWLILSTPIALDIFIAAQSLIDTTI